jgi:RNA polymerase sigma-70 factor (ECF subfamily)
VPSEPHPLLESRVKAEEPHLRAYLRRRLRAHEDVEDYVQEVYARVLATPPAAEVASWQGLLRRIASNLIVDSSRRARARSAALHVALEPDFEIRDEGPSPEEALLARQRLEVVAEAIRQASPIARAVFLLVRVEGLTHRAAAERLGIDAKVASRHVERVLALISRRLAETIRP